MSAAWWTILIGAAATLAMRASFLVVAPRMAQFPPWAHRLLRQIPPAALAALVLPAFVRPDGQLELWGPRAVAGLLAGIVAWRTRNTLATLVVGMVAAVAFGAVMG